MKLKAMDNSLLGRSQNNDNFYLLFYFLFSVTLIVVYGLPGIVSYAYFILLLGVFFYSKAVTFWLAFFWCLIYAPGYLFNLADENHCLPFFALPGLGRDIAFTEVLTIVIFLKSFKERSLGKVNRIFWVLVLFVVILIFVTTIFGSSSTKIARTIRFLLPYTLIWSIPKLISKEGMEIVFKYFLSFTIPIILCQLYVIASGQHLMFLFGGSFSGKKELLNEINFDANSDLIRPSYSTHILLLNVFFCCYNLLSNNSSTFRYNLVFLILTLVSFVITGTRGYFLGSLSVLFVYLVLDYKKVVLNALKIFIGVLGFFGLLFVPKIGAQLSFAFERLLTIQDLLSGDATAGGTLIRLTQRLPAVMEKVRESPMLGYGFSDTYYKNADGHVANATLLLNGGIIGAIVFATFMFLIFKLVYKAYKNSGNRQYLAINAGLIGFLVVHSTSYMVFSYLFGQGNYLCFVLLLCFANIVFEESRLSVNAKNNGFNVYSKV